MTKCTLQFWYDPASTYAYLSVMRIEELAAAAGIEIAWKPFLLGPIFQAQGWNTSPFNIYPAKGRYMARDLERLAAERGLIFRLPNPMPAYSLHAARMAVAGLDEGWTPAFTRAVFLAAFTRGENIAEPDVLARCARAAGIDPETARAKANEQTVKDRLRMHTGEAISRGIFGAPSFITPDGELFWGDDRLENAVRWMTRPVPVAS